MIEKKNTNTSEMAADIATMDIYAFMPAAAKKRVDEVKTVPAPPGFLKADGTRASMKLRKLPYETIQSIVKEHRTKEIVRDKKGRPETTGAGRATVIEDSDATQMAVAMVAASLVYPNLKDQKLAEAYGVIHPEDLVLEIFNTSEAFTYIVEQVNEVNGLGRSGDEEGLEQQLIDQAKN